MQAFAVGADGDANQAKTAHYNAQMRQYFTVEKQRQTENLKKLKC